MIFYSLNGKNKFMLYVIEIFEMIMHSLIELCEELGGKDFSNDK